MENSSGNSKDFVVFDVLKKVENSPQKEAFPVKSREKKTTHTDVTEQINAVSRYSERAVTCLKNAQTEYYDNVESLSWAAYLLEKSLEKVREIANCITNDSEKELSELAVPSPFLVTAKQENGYFKIDVPMLMPKRKANQKTNYFSTELDHALQNMVIPTEYKEENIAIIFLHCYQKNHASLAKKDHDNIEIKWIIDALNNHFFIDDGPFRTSLYHHSTIDEVDHTCIYLVPFWNLIDFLKVHFPKWETQKNQFLSKN